MVLTRVPLRRGRPSSWRRGRWREVERRRARRLARDVVRARSTGALICSMASSSVSRRGRRKCDSCPTVKREAGTTTTSMCSARAGCRVTRRVGSSSRATASWTDSPTSAARRRALGERLELGGVLGERIAHVDERRAHLVVFSSGVLPVFTEYVELLNRYVQANAVNFIVVVGFFSSEVVSIELQRKAKVQ